MKSIPPAVYVLGFHVPTDRRLPPLVRMVFLSLLLSLTMSPQFIIPYLLPPVRN